MAIKKALRRAEAPPRGFYNGKRPDYPRLKPYIYPKNQTTNQTTTNRDKIKADKKEETTIQTENRPQADQEQTANQTQTITTNNYTIITNNR